MSTDHTSEFATSGTSPGTSRTTAPASKSVPLEPAHETCLQNNIFGLLFDPVFRFSSCLHEAAHGVYIRRAGRAFVIHTPTVLRNAVATLSITPCAGRRVKSVDVARWWCAPLAALTNAENAAGGDIEDFPTEIRKMFPFPKITDAKIAALWKRAITDVRRDLRRPETRREIYALAHEFEDWLLKELRGHAWKYFVVNSATKLFPSKAVPR